MSWVEPHDIEHLFFYFYVEEIFVVGFFFFISTWQFIDSDWSIVAEITLLVYGCGPEC